MGEELWKSKESIKGRGRMKEEKEGENEGARAGEPLSVAGGIINRVEEDYY